jgi:RHS repeat-associated protein
VETYSYHPAGGIIDKELQVNPLYPGTNYPIGTPATLDVYYTFNQAGQIATTTYPTTGSQYNQTTNAYTPNTFTYAYDTMGRPNSLKVDSTFANPYSPTGYNWVQNVTYDYAGRRSSLQYWDGNWDGSYMSESKTWNGSGQLASVSFSSYALSGGMQYSYSATQNNGQITQAVDTVSGETIVYQYDLLKRLVSASATPTSGSPSAAWTETFQYDGFGNLTAKVLNGTSTPIPVNAATNQLTNAYYDANGNMTSGAGASFTYDASNRIVSETAVSGGNYSNEYAPDNKRIHQTPSSGTDEWIFYGANGEKLGVYSIGQWYDNNDNAHSVFSPLRTSIWFSGKLIYENGLVYLDRLGTNHAQNAQFLPYGDEITSTSNDRTKFATYTRDSYTGLDYADQRFYASTYGRFMTPDPSGKSAKAGTPGSWNRYSYAQGDPANRKDPRGLDICDDDPAACGDFFADSYGEDNGVAFDTPNCGLLTIDYIDNQLGDPDDSSCFDSTGSTTTTSTPPPPPTCTIELWERPVPFKGSPANHTYIYVQDPNDPTGLIFEGAPSGFFIGSSLIGQYQPPASALGSNKPNNPIASNPALPSNHEVGGPDTSSYACGQISEMEAAVTNYNSNPVTYTFLGILGYNSNSFTNTLLNQFGISFGNPPGWVPGWNKTVPGL